MTAGAAPAAVVAASGMPLYAGPNTTCTPAPKRARMVAAYAALKDRTANSRTGSTGAGRCALVARGAVLVELDQP